MTKTKHCADAVEPLRACLYQACCYSKDGPLGMMRAIASFRRTEYAAPHCTLDTRWRVCADE